MLENRIKRHRANQSNSGARRHPWYALCYIWNFKKKITPTVRDREGGRRKTERVDRSVERGTWTDAVKIPMPL